jgi:hypothetical protein
MIKVKHFSDSDDLGPDINKWVEETGSIIVDMKFAINGADWHYAYILYREGDKQTLNG